MDDPSVSFWIDKLKGGNQAAAQPLWNRYFQKLVHLAYQRLQNRNRAVADEEDVALSAFKSFCAAAEQGRFPELQDRDDLWRLLVVITERKALNQIRDQHRQKRGGATPPAPLESHDPSPEPTPLFAAIMAEECQRLFDALETEPLRRIAVDKMEGYTNAEIATRHSLALRTVERKLSLIRRIWEQMPRAEG